MPMRDGTGPTGRGPMTGRGMGPCGAGYGRGYGRGFNCPRYPVNISKEDEKKLLEEELEIIKKRLKELE